MRAKYQLTSPYDVTVVPFPKVHTRELAEVIDLKDQAELEVWVSLAPRRPSIDRRLMGPKNMSSLVMKAWRVPPIFRQLIVHETVITFEQVSISIR